MDLYLFDGVKVLHRYGLALFKLHKKRIKAGEFKYLFIDFFRFIFKITFLLHLVCRTGEEFWNEMKKYQNNSESFNFATFHNFAFDRDQNVLKTKIVPRKLINISLSLFHSLSLTFTISFSFHILLLLLFVSACNYS